MPAITEARSSPARPSRAAMGASTTTKAAVGPVTWSSNRRAAPPRPRPRRCRGRAAAPPRTRWPAPWTEAAPPPRRPARERVTGQFLPAYPAAKVCLSAMPGRSPRRSSLSSADRYRVTTLHRHVHDGGDSTPWRRPGWRCDGRSFAATLGPSASAPPGRLRSSACSCSAPRSRVRRRAGLAVSRCSPSPVRHWWLRSGGRRASGGAVTAVLLRDAFEPSVAVQASATAVGVRHGPSSDDQRRSSSRCILPPDRVAVATASPRSRPGAWPARRGRGSAASPSIPGLPRFRPRPAGAPEGWWYRRSGWRASLAGPRSTRWPRWDPSWSTRPAG